MRQKRINFISLGCSKNLVDSERLMKLFYDAGYKVLHEYSPEKHDVVVINTCGFIGDAKEESINTILEFLEDKRKGKIDRVYVMGCLSQRYLEELKAELPDVDGWYGKFDFTKIIEQETENTLKKSG